MKNFRIHLLFVICLIGLLSCKKEVEVSVIEKIKGNYELKGGFEYRFTDEPLTWYEVTPATTKFSANKGGTPTEIQLALFYWGAGLVLAEQTTPNVFELKPSNVIVKLFKEGIVETYSLQLTGNVSFVDNTVFVKIIGKDESKKLIVTYDYTGMKIP
jgi:hypothetical protein